MSPERELSAHLPSGIGRDCSWVRENLGAYDLWDDSLSQAEFGAIEGHLQQCPACASEYADIRRARQTIEMTVAGLDRDAWEQEKKEFSAKILARLRETGIFDGEVATSPTVVPLAAPRIHLYEPAEPRQDDTRQGPRRGKRLLVMVASLLLTFALPVLALVVVREFLSTSTASESSAESHKDRTTTNRQFPPPPPQGSDGPSIEKAAPNVDALNGALIATETLDAATEAKLRDFELAALLPDTEAEYEALARKEYPHVMGLYDTLTEVDENDPNAVPLWDGVPVNIPVWGNKLYGEVSPDERPTGWCALLIYSGEIFKFDWPTNVNDANCRPTLQALQLAVKISGFTLEYDEKGAYLAQHLPYADADTGEHRFQLRPFRGNATEPALQAHDTPEDYVALVTADVTREKALWCYLATSSALVRIKAFDTLTDRAQKLLGEYFFQCRSECNVRIRTLSLIDFLGSRRELMLPLGMLTTVQNR